MSRIYKFVFAVLFIIAPYLSVIAQDGRNATQNITLQVAGTALLGVAGPPVVLKLAGAMEAGDSVTNEATNSATRLRISSLVLGEESRSITAKISEPLVGTQLSVELAAPNANFGVPEQKGDLKGSKYLDSEIEAILVDGIGTCWSGKSDDDGYVIKYAFKALRGAPLLRSSNVTVTYTISQTPSELELVE